MNHSATGKARFSKGMRIGFGLAFLFSFLFMLAGYIPVLPNLAGFQARFTGIETTGRATEDTSCDDGGGMFSFTFTDKHEKAYHIANDSTCFSGIYSDGERVTLWYQPDDPNHFITANEWSFDLIFIIAFSIPFFLVLIAFVFVLFRRFRGSRASRERVGNARAGVM